MITIFNGRKRTLGNGEEKDVYITMSVDFREHLVNLKGAKLSVFMCIALHADSDGWSFPSASVISKETGYNKETVFSVLAELESTLINGQRLLLRKRHREHGAFSSNRYLIFPSEAEIQSYEETELPSGFSVYG